MNVRSVYLLGATIWTAVMFMSVASRVPGSALFDFLMASYYAVGYLRAEQ